VIRMSRLTDYAVVVLTRMALCPGRPAYTAAELADQSGVPAPTVVKVLKQLARAGIVAAQRGARGGYRLARSPGEVTLKEIIGAFDGPIRIADCVGGGGRGCRIEETCPTRGVWERVNEAIVDTLGGITLAEMCANPVVPAPAKLEPRAGGMMV